MTNRKKPGVAFWATVVVVVALVAYPMSFGPACWLAATPKTGTLPKLHKAMIVYWPLGLASRWKGPVGTTVVDRTRKASQPHRFGPNKSERNQRGALRTRTEMNLGGSLALTSTQVVDAADSREWLVGGTR